MIMLLVTIIKILHLFCLFIYLFVLFFKFPAVTLLFRVLWLFFFSFEETINLLKIKLVKNQQECQKKIFLWEWTLDVIIFFIEFYDFFDKNHDDHIDFKEFVCGVSLCCRGLTKDRLHGKMSLFFFHGLEFKFPYFFHGLQFQFPY